MPTSPVMLPPRPWAPATAPGAPQWSDIVTQWRPDPLTLALIAAAVGGYAWYRMRARRAGVAWSHGRDAVFGLGTLAAVWVCSGPAQVRAGQLEWVFVAQLLALLLVVPLVMLAGQPVQLARQLRGDAAPVCRMIRSRPVRILANPLVGPALVPVILLLVLYGGVGQTAATSAPAGWVLHAVLLLVGAMIALPLVDAGDERSSLAVGLALAVGFLELIMDVFPGIALRLAGHPVIGYFATHTPAWAGGWLYEQHQAGGLLWMALEVLDLPFLVFLAVRWVRVDTAEAARMDAALDAQERLSAAGVAPGAAADPAASPGVVTAGGGVLGAGPVTPQRPAVARRRDGESGRPWFLDDPQLRDRYRF